MAPAMMTRLMIIIMAFDTLGVILAVALSLIFHHTIFDLLTWVFTLIPMVLLGTAVGVWQAMKMLQQ